MAAPPEHIEQQQENVHYAPAMVAPAPGFHPNMMGAPVILPAGAQVTTSHGAPTMASAMQQPDMSMAQWVYGQQGMQMMVPVQMMQGGMIPGGGMQMMMPQMVHPAAEQNGLPPGAPCMWVPALGTSAKPDKFEAGQRVMPQQQIVAAPRLIAPKYAPPLPPKAAKAAEYAQSAALGNPVSEVKAVRPVARQVAPGIAKPAPAKGGARGAKGINMKWRTRYVL